MDRKFFFLRAGLIGMLVVLFGTGSPAYSQSQMGIKGGVSFANLGGAQGLDEDIEAVVPAAEPGSLIWWTASVWSAQELIPRLVALQMELTYWRGGKSWGEIGAGGDDEDHLKLYVDYLQIPLFLKVLIPLTRYIIPNVYIGPQVSIAFRARGENIDLLPARIQAISPFFADVDISSPIMDYAKNTFDAGFVAGAGFQIPSGYGNFDFDFRYIFGGLDVYNFPGATEIRNYAFLMMGGFSINLGGKCP